MKVLVILVKAVKLNCVFGLSFAHLSLIEDPKLISAYKLVGWTGNVNKTEVPKSENHANKERINTTTQAATTRSQK